MTIYRVTATHWNRGWELHIEGVGVTQCRCLDEAESTVREYIKFRTGTDSGEAMIVVRFEVGGDLGKQAQAARAATRAAEIATREAAAQSRKMARDLSEAGLTGRDIAKVLGVSAQRISQLLKSA